MLDIGTENSKSSSQSRREQIEKIIRKYSDLIFRTAYQNLKNYHDAQDITQEVCVVVVTSGVTLEDEARLRNWLITVTLNKCRDFRKSAWNRKTEPLEDTFAAVDPESYRLFEELWKLSENYRNVLYLFYYEEFTVDEIAKILGKSRNTVGSWLQRGRKKLRKILEDGGYNYD